MNSMVLESKTQEGYCRFLCTKCGYRHGIWESDMHDPEYDTLCWECANIKSIGYGKTEKIITYKDGTYKEIKGDINYGIKQKPIC